MKPMTLRLIAVTTVALSVSAARAELPTVYGTTFRAERPAFLPESNRLYVVTDGPTAGVFGAVSVSAALPGRDLSVGPRVIDGDVGARVSVDPPVRQERHDHAATAVGRTNASAALDMTDTIHAIKVASLPARTSLLSDVNARLDASRQAMAVLSARAEVLQGDARAAFKVAAKHVRASEKALRHSVRQAQTARAETWGAARAALADHYDSYAEAVAHAEAVASVSVPGTPVAADPDRGALEVDPNVSARNVAAVGAMP